MFNSKYMVVLKTAVVFILLLIMTGCVRGWPPPGLGEQPNTGEPADTSVPEPEQSETSGSAPEPTPASPAGSGTGQAAPGAKVDDYDFLKDELANNIALMESAQDPFNYAGELSDAFAEMLGFRQSLKDFFEPMNLTNDGAYSAGWIDVWPVFTQDGMSYRVVKLSVNSSANERMYVQIYNDDYFESQWIYEYQNEGGVEGEIVFCGFVQESNATYLIIIHEESGIDSKNSCYLVNYEVYGSEIRNYEALYREYTNEAWSVRGVNNRSLKLNRTEVTPLTSSYLPGARRCVFDYNMFEVSLNNADNDVITLTFDNGFWEPSTYTPSALTRLRAYYDAIAIAEGWLDAHTDIIEYTVHDYSYLPYEIPPTTYGFLEEEYYELPTTYKRRYEPERYIVILVPAESGELLAHYTNIVSEPGGLQWATIVETMDDWYNGVHAAYTPPLLSAEGALEVFESWMVNNLSEDDYNNYSTRCRLSRDVYGSYEMLGEQYYYFRAEEGMNYWYNILVHMQTGEVLFLLITDGMFGEEVVMQANDWFNPVYY